MRTETNRRTFVKGAFLGLTGGLAFLAGCIAPRVSQSAREKSSGKPWRCTNCGHLTRSDEDLSNERCPRCYSKKLVSVTEAEFAEHLKKASAEK